MSPDHHPTVLDRVAHWRLAWPRDTVLGRLSRWLLAAPVPLRSTEAARRRASSFVMTGPDLVERVARSIQLNQSILLEGPRGCGKSFCVRKGIDLAADRGYIPAKAEVFVQGNREIPRDYLAEDEIAFRLLNPTSRNPTVRPYRRSAPLFRFAKRTLEEGEPEKRGPRDDHVVCETEDKQPLERFVLFLDEINRFSDGVLDSLLSVLEERTAVLAGRKYILPVTVCMTMNPPGYDSSARKLSPPLAARIGRNYRLSTPDLDTLTDFIVAERWAEAKAEYATEAQRAKTSNQALVAHLQAQLDASTGKKERVDLGRRIGQARREGEVYYSDFPPEDPLLIRKASLITLCLWGDVSAEQREPGMEYLTDETQELLKEVMRRDRQIGNEMKKLTGLCHYGPDGRAVADWIVSATAKSLEDASAARQPAKLKAQHLVDTVLDTICHKIYDKFSPATQPHKTQLKEQIVDKIARLVLIRGGLDDLLLRKVDDAQFLWENIVQHLIDPPDAPSRFEGCEAVRLAFIQSRVTSNAELGAWVSVINTARYTAGARTIEDILCNKHGEGVDEILIAAEPVEGGERAGFSNPRNYQLVRALARLDYLHGVGLQLGELVKAVGPVRRSLAAELTDRSIVELIGVQDFRKECGEITGRGGLLAIADELEDLYNRDLAAEWGQLVAARSKSAKPAEVDPFLDGIKDETNKSLQPRVGETQIAAASAAMKRLLKLAAWQLYASGAPGSDDNAELLLMLAERF